MYNKNSYYTIFIGKDNQWWFNLKAGNHEIILQSEGYTSKQGVLNGIKSVQSNCIEDSNYVRKTAVDNSPYFVLKAANGEIIGRSEMFSSEQMRDRSIDSVKNYGLTSKIKEPNDSKFRISINKSEYLVDKLKLNGSEILNLANLSSNQYSLFLIKGNNQKEINADEYVKMKDGLCFQAIISDIKFG
jgi:uncharacterized protein